MRIDEPQSALPSGLPRLPYPALRILRRAIAWALLLSLLVGAGTWGVVRVGRGLGPLLARVKWLCIDEVQITAQWPLDENVVRSWLPGLKGESILVVRAGELVESLRQRPWVENVTIQKQYPNRIAVDVTTKRAKAILLSKGVPYFLDADGNLIERASAKLLGELDLPAITVDKRAAGEWKLAEMIAVIEKIQGALEPERRISEVVLEPMRLFRVFTQPLPVELIFSLDTWETQVPHLLLLLRHPLPSLAQPRKINLIFPKKTIVSSPEAK